MLIPAPPESELRQAGITVSAPALISAATLAVADLGQFCGRQPGVCETAGFVAAKIEAKAKYSVRVIYEWANEADAAPAAQPVGDIQAGKADPIVTGSTQQVAATIPVDADGGTLTPNDYVPEWRGPGAVKKS